ncbi:hypothetical protein Vretimale_1887 [Volvox reticuliferus]|nr:hypothetical protein Vretimale_1887 [Volvox reticuliferus]
MAVSHVSNLGIAWVKTAPACTVPSMSLLLFDSLDLRLPPPLPALSHYATHIRRQALLFCDTHTPLPSPPLLVFSIRQRQVRRRPTRMQAEPAQVHPGLPQQTPPKPQPHCQPPCSSTEGSRRRDLLLMTGSVLAGWITGIRPTSELQAFAAEGITTVCGGHVWEQC